mgnify:CR=1 FL=1
MRDPRFLEDSAHLRTDARAEAARERFAATPDRIEIDRVLEAWWSNVLAQDSLGDPWKAEQIEALRTACSSLPAVALTAPDTLAMTAEDRDFGAVLLGETAATVIRRSTAAAPLDRAVRFLARESWGAVEALAEALLRPPAWPASMETLAFKNAPIAGLLATSFRGVPDDELLAQKEREARGRGLLAYVQYDRNELHLNEAALVRLALLARRDWNGIGVHVDALPLRALKTSSWWRLHLDEDRDAMLALLRTAPPVFDDGKWTGSTAALAAMDASLRHVTRLYEHLDRQTRVAAEPEEAREKLTAFMTQEAPAWLTQVAEAAIGRTDSRILLLAFGANLVRTCVSLSNRWSAAILGLNAIYGVLDPKPSVAEVKNVAKAGGAPDNPTNIDDATYLITSALFDADPDEVWRWYRDLLLRTDQDLCEQAKAKARRTLCFHVVAERLGQLTDPFAEWKAAWNALFVTDRERARFARIDNALHPSLHLLRVGAELLRQSPTRAGARSFFVDLLAYGRYLVANDISPLKPESALFDAMDVAPLLGPDWQATLKDHRSVFSGAKRRLFAAAGLIEGGASCADAEAAIEAPPYRLADSIAEARAFNEGKAHYERDNELAHVCEVVANAAASESERSR